MTTTFLVVKNNAAGVLASGISSTSTSLNLNAGEGANFPDTFPFHISIDSEIIQVGGKSGDTLTSLTRAQQGTTAATHNTGADVELRVTAKTITDLNTAVNAIETDHENINAPHHGQSHDHSAAGDGQSLVPNLLRLPNQGTLTISTGAITATGSRHLIDTEAAAATDDLDTINGGADGQILIVSPANDARTVVIKHDTGNISCVGQVDISMDDVEDFALLVYDATQTRWFALQGGAAGGGGGGNTLDQAYDQGGAGAGRTITADSGAVEAIITALAKGFQVRQASDTHDRISIGLNSLGEGRITFGPGNATHDTAIQRISANKAGIDDDDTWRAKNIESDVINERTAGAGVTLDGVLLRDSKVEIGQTFAGYLDFGSEPLGSQTYTP